MNTPRKIIIHHYGGVNGVSTQRFTAQDVDQWHKDRWSGFTSKVFKNEHGNFYHVGYHYIVEKDGKIVQTRAHSEEGAHVIGMNTSSIGICVAGNFDIGVDTPTREQQDSVIKLYEAIRKEYPNLTVEDIEPHRKYATKTCWGSGLTDDYWKGIITSEIDTTTEDRKDELQKTIDHLNRVLSLLLQIVSLRRLSLREQGKT